MSQIRFRVTTIELAPKIWHKNYDFRERKRHEEKGNDISFTQPIKQKETYL